MYGFSFGANRAARRRRVAGSAPLTIGSLPTGLPSTPNATATDAANLKALVAAATGTYYIAVPDGADWDIGSTNYNNGAGTTDLTWNITNTTAAAIYIAPASFYAQNFTYEANPYGDGNRYTRRLVRPAQLRGFISCAAGTTVHLWGFKRTINIYPTAPNAAPGSYQTWQDVGVATSSYLDQASGTFNGSFRWNEYFMGKDAAHTPFDITEKLFDFNSPDYWNYGTNRISRCTIASVTFASGSTTLTVNSASARPIAVGDKIVLHGTVPDITAGQTIVAQLTGTPGGAGTYQMSAAATASNTYAQSSGSGNYVFFSECVDNSLFIGWGDASYANYNRMYYMPSAVYVTGWTGSTLTVSDNYIHDLYDGVRALANASARRHLIVNDNEISRLYHDYRRFNWASNARLRVTSLRNILTNPLPGVKDSFDSHGDADQAFGNTAPSAEVGQYGWNIGLNLVVVDVNCRGIFQSQFYQMLYQNVLVGLKSFNNLVANTNKGFHAESQRGTWHKDSVYISQELNRPNSGNFPRSSISIKSKTSTGATTVVGPIRIQDVICEGLVTSGPSATVRKAGDNSNDLPVWNTVGRSALTSPLFANLNRATPTVNDYFLMMAEMGPAAGTRGSKYSTLAAMMSADVTHEVLAMFEDQGGVDASSTVTSARTYVHGIEGTSIAVVPGSGVSWATYDPSDGTAIRAMAPGSGTILAGQDIAIQDTSSASYLTEKLSQVSLDGAPYYFRNITRSNTFFPTIDNAARTAWSRFAAPSPSGTFVGFVVALIGLKLDKFSSSAPSDNNANVMGSSSLSSAAFRLFLNTLSPLNLRGNFFGSGAGSSQLRWDIGNDLNRHTYLLACDLTQTDPDLAFKLVKDYSLVASNPANTSVDTLGGTKTFNAAALFGSGWGVFNTYTSATLIDGSLQALRVSLYTNPADIPDIGNIDVINGFTADRINSADASTPVDPSPAFKALWQGNLAAWNSSVAAVGDTTNALTVQAGTYA